MSKQFDLQPLRFPLQGIQLIEASAGTGKTFTLAALYVRFVLAHGSDTPRGYAFLPSDILVVTFTKAATEELRDRIRARLIEAAEVFRERQQGDEFLQALRAEYSPEQFASCAARLQMAAEWMDEAAIFTIHGWCQRMLREHAFDSGMGFAQEMAHDLTEIHLLAARDYWRTWIYPLKDSRLLEHLGGLSESPEALLKHIRPWLRPDAGLISFHAGGEPLPPMQRPDEVGQTLHAWYHHLDSAVQTLKPYLNQEFLDILRELQALKLNKRSYSDTKWLEIDLPRWQRWISYPDRIEILNKEDAEHLARFNPETLKTRLKKGYELPEHPAFVKLASLHERVLARPDGYRAVVQHAAQWVAARIEEEKERRAVLGFDDLLTRLHQALMRDGGGVLAARIRAQFPVAMVDEFQDTDPAQFAIFRAIYPTIDADDYSLTLVGDPKQAIYSFRGADLQTYLRAREWTQGRHYNLPKNFRSVAPLVQAVNALFLRGETLASGSFGFRQQGTDAGSEIVNAVPYYEVKAEGKSSQYIEDGKAAPVLNYWLTREHPADFRKADYMTRLASACADRIAYMLNGSAEGRFGVQSATSLHALTPSSFAVLVRSRREANQIAEALAMRGVRSVFLSDRDSVFATDEAKTLLTWLQAIHAPENEQKLRMALLLRLSMQSDRQLALWLDDEQAWETILEHCRTLQRIWRQQGILPMIRMWFQLFGLPSRWLTLVEGERVLTNMLHLAELLQRESAHRDGEAGLMRWFASHVQEPSSVDEQIQRLESDASRVQIVTIHKSKGLQYDFVFLPFIANVQSTSDAWLRYGEENETILDIAPNDEVKEKAERERLLEDVRLLYVALTRAVYGCWLGLATYGHKNSSSSVLDRSAIGYLLNLPSKPIPTDVQAALQTLPWYEDSFPQYTIWQAPIASASVKQALRLAQPVMRERWWIASYSALRTQPKHDLASLEGRASERSPDSALHAQLQDDDTLLADDLFSHVAPQSAVSARATLHNFPRGAVIGTFLHGLLEWSCETGFRQVAGDADEQNRFLQKRLQQRGLQVFLEPLQQWLDHVLTVPLACPNTQETRSLATLEQAVSELEFWLEAQRVSVQQIDALAQAFFWPGAPRPALAAETLNGMLKGFIDLTFTAADGRYWVCDFKSNWLGDSSAAYTQHAMQKAMLEKRYDVQATLYIFALHRLLRARQPNYQGNEAKYLGGAMYWFIREPSLGQLWMPSSPELVLALDELFRGRDGDGSTFAREGGAHGN